MAQARMNDYLMAMAGRAAIESRMLDVLLESTVMRECADLKMKQLTQLLSDYNTLMAPLLGPDTTQLAAANDEEIQKS